MNFSHIRIKGSGVEITQKIQSIVEHKLQTLLKIIQKNAVIHCEVELEKIASHQSGKIHRTEINVTLDGVVYRAEALETQMEHAIDVARDEIRAEILRARGKRERLRKQGQKKIKEMLHSENL